MGQAGGGSCLVSAYGLTLILYLRPPLSLTMPSSRRLFACGTAVLVGVGLWVILVAALHTPSTSHKKRTLAHSLPSPSNVTACTKNYDKIVMQAQLAPHEPLHCRSVAHQTFCISAPAQQPHLASSNTTVPPYPVSFSWLSIFYNVSMIALPLTSVTVPGEVSGIPPEWLESNTTLDAGVLAWKRK